MCYLFVWSSKKKKKERKKWRGNSTQEAVCFSDLLKGRQSHHHTRGNLLLPSPALVALQLSPAMAAAARPRRHPTQALSIALWREETTQCLTQRPGQSCGTYLCVLCYAYSRWAEVEGRRELLTSSFPSQCCPLLPPSLCLCLFLSFCFFPSVCVSPLLFLFL